VSAGDRSSELPCLAFLHCPPTSTPLTLDLVSAGKGDPKDIERLGEALRGKAAYARPADIMRSLRNRNLTAAGAAACIFGSHADTHDACIISFVRKDIPAPVPALGLSRSGSNLLEGFLAEGNPRVTLEVSGDTVPSRSGNLVATLHGRTSLPEIVVGGHLDSYDLCEGALDNGAGVALILETARIFSTLPQPLRTLRFALFTGEEVSSTGSRRWVAEALREPGQVGLFVNVDMPVEGGVPGVLSGLGTGDAAVWDRMGKELGRRIPVRPADDRFSDHVSFAERGVPCFWLRAQNTGSRGPARIEHTTLDTADRVDPFELQDATSLAARLLLRFAEAETLPFQQPMPSPLRPVSNPAA
jgi:carboxypeptidase Q